MIPFQKSLLRHIRRLVRRIRKTPPPRPLWIENREAQAHRAAAIPSVIYQTMEMRWSHPKFFESIESLRELNSDFSFVVFDASERDEYMRATWGHHEISRIYFDSLFGQMRADIFRYCVVFERGGFYLDINKGLSWPIGKFLSDGDEGLISFERNQTYIFPPEAAARQILQPDLFVIQSFFGFSAEHRVLAQAIQQIVELEPFFRGVSFDYPKGAITTLTGPGLFTRVLREVAGKGGLEGVRQVAPDFTDHFVPRLPGSRKYLNPKIHYAKLQNYPLFLSEAEGLVGLPDAEAPLRRAVSFHGLGGKSNLVKGP